MSRHAELSFPIVAPQSWATSPAPDPHEQSERTVVESFAATDRALGDGGTVGASSPMAEKHTSEWCATAEVWAPNPNDGAVMQHSVSVFGAQALIVIII